MKVKIALLIFIGSMCVSLNAQKAKFKNQRCVVQIAQLPSHYVNAENRSYQISKKGIYAPNVVEDNAKLYGWTEDSENPDVKAVVSLYGFQLGSAKKDSQKRQKKDKDGKVTDTWTEYAYSNQASGLATLYVYGPNNKFEYNRKDDEQQAEKKEEKPTNSFLAAAGVEAEESDIGEDTGLEDVELKLVAKTSVNQTKSIKTRYYRKSADAYKDYKQKLNTLTELKHSYPQAAFNAAASKFNSYYGYKPVNQTFFLRRMKSDGHPQYKTWNEAVDAAVTLFKGVKFNQDIVQKREQFAPIVQYFSDQLSSLSPKDKKATKHRKAAFTNLTEILKGLDYHDAVIGWSDKYMSDKKLDGLAKRAKRSAEYTKAHLEFHKMDSRHIMSNEEVDENAIESEEIAAADDEG